MIPRCAPSFSLRRVCSDHSMAELVCHNQRVSYDFSKRQIETCARVGKTQWTIHVARTVDLDDAETRVLLMVGTQAAVVRAAMFDRRGVLQRNRAGFV